MAKSKSSKSKSKSTSEFKIELLEELIDDYIMHDVADGEGIDMIFFSAIVWVELGSKYDNVKSFFDNEVT